MKIILQSMLFDFMHTVPIFDIKDKIDHTFFYILHVNTQMLIKGTYDLELVNIRLNNSSARKITSETKVRIMH